MLHVDVCRSLGEVGQFRAASQTRAIESACLFALSNSCFYFHSFSDVLNK